MLHSVQNIFLSACIFLHHRRRYQKSQKINIFHSKVSCKLSPFIKLKKFDSYVSERYVNILYKLQKSNENAKILRKSMNMKNVQRGTGNDKRATSNVQRETRNGECNYNLVF